MPTLDWMGKDKVVDYYHQVPYRILTPVPERGVLDSHGSDCGNMVIHGDNLEALKALLPEYEGQVDCVYIDPPYNTGNEGWVYNDNVNDPRIRKWLGEVVGKEGEDLSRHDKWLCMMYPRLQLLRKMLKPTGAIFISIDDNEESNLRAICDEIFSPSCFLANISWQRTLTKRNDSKGVSAEVEHLLVYSKTTGFVPKRLPRKAETDSAYSSPDGDPRPWSSVTCSAPGAPTHQGMVYAIQHPITGKLMYPPVGRCWSLGQDRMLAEMSQWSDYCLRPIDDADKRAEICRGREVDQNLPAIMLVDDSKATLQQALSRYRLGEDGKEPWPRFFFTSHGKGGMRTKKYLDESAGRVATNFWPADEVGTTDGAKRQLARIFGGTAPFDTPKPPELIERCIRLVCGDAGNGLVLDAFAGSGATAHAVLNLNQANGTYLRFALIEMDDYADSVTAERLRHVLSGYGSGKNLTPAIDSGFSYYELGPSLFVTDGQSDVSYHVITGDFAGLGNGLDPAVPRIEAMRYVWYTETKARFEDRTSEHPYLMGEVGGVVYYLAWEPDGETTLDYGLLSQLPVRGETTVIYADRCVLDDAALDDMDVRFKQIPRQIARM